MVASGAGGTPILVDKQSIGETAYRVRTLQNKMVLWT